VGAIIFLEADEPGVFDTVALRRRGWEKNPFRQLLLGLKLDLIVGPGQRQHPSDCVPVRDARLTRFHFETGAQFFQCKRLSKLVHRSPCKFVAQSQLKEFSLKECLVVTGVRNLTRLGKEACWRQDLDPMVGVNDTRSKNDGRNMSLAGGA
jgi:hypothetical protein